MVAAMMSLRHFAAADFKDLGASWLGEIFQLGHVYKRVSTDEVMVCLGFHYRVAFMWHLVPCGDGQFFLLSESNMSSSDAALRFEPVFLSAFPASDGQQQQWHGIPCKVCS